MTQTGAHPDGLAQAALLDLLTEAMSGAVLIYDRNDTIVFASTQLRAFLPALPLMPSPGTRLKDFLSLVYDHGGYFPDVTGRLRHPPMGREEWITTEIASLWRERSETVERQALDRWMSLSKRRMPSGYGLCLFRDVSEHKKREDQWRSDLERVQITEDILDNLPFPILVMDRNFTYVAVNKATCSFYNLAADEILGRKNDDIHPPELAARIDRASRQVLETGIPFSISEQVIRPDGSRTAVLTRKLRAGKPGRYFVVTAMEDISEVLSTGEQPEWVFNGLEGVDFVHSDMRLKRSEQPAAVPAERTGRRRVLLVTDDGKVEADGVSLLLRAGFDATAARDLRELRGILDIARERQVDIDLVVVDSAMDIECLEEAEASGIDVLVLEAFQVERELLVAVQRRLARPRPAPAARKAAEDDWQISSVAAIDVLVAEDNQVNQIVFSQILEGFGYRYAIACDGEEAVRLWRDLKPRIVLMDITLPMLNGFEAASRIRELESGGERTPIIGVLTPAVEGDRDACWAAGMDDVVLKPLSPDALDEKFRRFMGAGDRETRRRGEGR
ncbi:PAS domain S-box-containing protein [Rhizobium sp. RU35A]|uniref:response regulator n=1 Tax=Rhizobium sp. RU35A TaxID=1907414 RepID=UPI000953A541|nr:response regulator [Rhizobium sp. RU35A]SIP99292.1 PAS domain S-box-containing protein [Rhizobium sp. RU35A]